MSKLEKLIEELCPDGVEYTALGELGKFYGGLTGKSKDDFTDGNAAFITYKNVYSNSALDIDPEDTVKIGEDENQRTLEYGDVVFTGSSETPNECGFSAVVTKTPEKALYLNSFCFFFRFYDISEVEPDFLKHLFRSYSLRCQIGKTASGVTRYNVSKEKMAKIPIPLPPLPIQEEIVRILDNFTELTDRKKQYEYYRDSLLTFGDEVPMVRLGEIATIIRGGNFQKKDFTESGVPCIHYGQIYTKYGLSATETITFTTYDVAKKSKVANKNDIVMAVTSENVEDVCKCVVWLGEDDVAISGHTAIIKHSQNAKFLAYYFHSAKFFKDKIKLAHGTKVIEVTPSKLADIKIPLPSLAEQQRIVDILDRFDFLCNDISKGLPAEIDERQKQYEYYRDKLLTFKNINAEV